MGRRLADGRELGRCGRVMEDVANEKSNSDTGEHISNEKNELEYIPFPVCNETGKPLELQYGVEDGMRSSLHQPSLEYICMKSAAELDKPSNAPSCWMNI
jgi:hypothetical protein